MVASREITFRNHLLALRAWVLGRGPLLLGLCLVMFLGLARTTLSADDSHKHNKASGRSLADTRLSLPSIEQFLNITTLRDYNTRIIAVGTVLLGISASAVGVFMLLRKRSLVGDVVSHASLPGIGIAYLLAESIQTGSGRNLPILLVGATVAGLGGVLCTVAIRRHTRIKEDAALAIVLSVFFGVGVCLLTLIQGLPTGNSAGLNHFIMGSTASLVAQDVYLIIAVTAMVLVTCCLLFKEFTLLCFDQRFGSTMGWPMGKLDVLLMGLVVAVTVIGLQSVGLLLIVAMLIIPAAAARFWSDQLFRVALLAMILGGTSSYVGVMVSALFPRLAAGPVIVLAESSFFVLSLLFGSRRGVLIRALNAYRVRYRILQQHLLRAMYEVLEASADNGPGLPWQTSIRVADLQQRRSWTAGELERSVNIARQERLVERRPNGDLVLTRFGRIEATRVARNHRMWELYLIHHADIAPSHVDRDADQIEHVLEPSMIERLESILSQEYPGMEVPPSPHDLQLGETSYDQ